MRDIPAQISYSAGSLAPNPNKFRVIDDAADNRLTQLATTFPKIGQILRSSPIMALAYPASLGIRGGGGVTVADTYLCDVTLKNVIRLASESRRPLVFVAQPLAGAELLSRAITDAAVTFPTTILWATGGYFMPCSLERSMREALRSRGSELDLLFAYGIAEVGHTCFASIHRQFDGTPAFRKVDNAVDAIVSPDPTCDTGPLRIHAASGGVGALLLKGPQNDSFIDSGDLANFDGQGTWSIVNNPDRLSNFVRDELESWNNELWSRRSGYVDTSDGKLRCQLRGDFRGSPGPGEVPYYRFWEKFGGELTSKPNWGTPRNRQVIAAERQAARDVSSAA